MDPHGPRLLGDADERVLHGPGVSPLHHEVAVLVHDQHLVGHGGPVGGVPARDVPEAFLLEEGVAPVHLVGEAQEGLLRLPGFGGDHAAQVWQVPVFPELHPLRIHQVDLHLPGLHERSDRADRTVQEHRLPRARRARHQQVRHRGQVQSHRPPGGRGPQHDRQHAAAGPVGHQGIFEAHGAAHLVGDFHAHAAGVAGDRAQDAHRVHAQVAGQVCFPGGQVPGLCSLVQGHQHRGHRGTRQGPLHQGAFEPVAAAEHSRQVGEPGGRCPCGLLGRRCLGGLGRHWRPGGGQPFGIA